MSSATVVAAGLTVGLVGFAVVAATARDGEVAPLIAGFALVAQIAALLGVLALTAASERVSFSAVIDGQPLLRRLDRLGRPAAVSASSGAEQPRR